jgi:pimeloyl-ACP methyl ester carboxylesterase
VAPQNLFRTNSYTVPLESDPSAALAYRLEGAPVWDFEIAGFLRGDLSFLGNRTSGDSSGLYMLHPYLPRLIPVVFVHGTASSPARWAEMANELLGDPFPETIAAIDDDHLGQESTLAVADDYHLVERGGLLVGDRRLCAPPAAIPAGASLTTR